MTEARLEARRRGGREGTPRGTGFSRIREVFAIAALLARLAARPLDVQVEACFNLWRSRPAIVVVMEDPAARQEGLRDRIDAMFPF